MLRRREFLLAAPAAFAFARAAGAATPGAGDPIVYLDTKYGRTTIELFPKLAPKHVAQIRTLVKRGFYDGLKFHRVIDGFMAQTGDPKGDGTGGSDLPNLPAEFTSTSFERGTIGMARAQDPDSANSQFFICLAPAPNLDNKYTVVGKVVSGMEFIDQIKKGPAEENGAVADPDTIVKMTMAK